MGAATRWEEISCEELIEQHADDYEDDEDGDEMRMTNLKPAMLVPRARWHHALSRRVNSYRQKRAKSASNHNAMNLKRKSLWVAASRLVSVL